MGRTSGPLVAHTAQPVRGAGAPDRPSGAPVCDRGPRPRRLIGTGYGDRVNVRAPTAAWYWLCSRPCG